MPLIEIVSVAKPSVELLNKIALEAASIFEIPSKRSWVFWNRLDHESSHLPTWGDESDNGAILRIRCKPTYSDDSVSKCLTTLSALVCAEMDIKHEAFLSIVDRVSSGNLFVEGEIWESSKPKHIEIKPIGVVRCERKEPIDDDWGQILSVIELDSTQFDEAAVMGLDQFSHLECIFHFHRVASEKIETGARKPRNIEHLPKIGIFAQRPKARPNRIGLSVCEIEKLEGTRIFVKGLDAIDGTPVIDVKPYFLNFAPRGNIKQPEWVSEALKNYY